MAALLCTAAVEAGTDNPKDVSLIPSTNTDNSYVISPKGIVRLTVLSKGDGSTATLTLNNFLDVNGNTVNVNFKKSEQGKQKESTKVVGVFTPRR